MKEFKLPDLGEGIEAGDIVQVLVAEGDTIVAEQTVVEIETDKAVLEVPCPFAGKVTKVHVSVGDHVPVGATIATLDADGEVAEAPAAEADEPAPAAAEPTPSVPQPEAPAAPEPAPAVQPAPATEQPVPAGPATRRLARELGVDLRAVAGVNPGVRLTKEHVKAFVRDRQSGGAPAAAVGIAVAPPPLPDFTQWGEVERVPFTSLQRKTAAHVSVGWSLAPHVTQFDSADITALETLRKRYRDTEQGQRVKLTVTAFVLKALATALDAYPQFNASLDTQANELVLKQYYHIGVAVDTPAGLIVPIIRDVDQKGVLEIAGEMNAIAERTRQRKVGLDELRGGTFTVTNLGGIGGTAFTPIINYPEVAILGLARSREEPVIRDGHFSKRLMLPLCLSYDHRVINGADGARFIRKLATLLEDPEMLLLGT